MKSKNDPIPKHFKTLDEAAEFWDTHDLADYWDQTSEVNFEFDLLRRVSLTGREIKLLDTVASVDDLSEHKLKRGEIGTVVEILAPDVFEVEFCNSEGETYSELALRREQLIAIQIKGRH